MKSLVSSERTLGTLLIVGFALIPLLVNLPYRINIFLSWEASYRLYLGQVPFRDFTLPMGYAFWLIPALFFKVFGPQLHTLVIAQVFINIVSGLAFWSILRTLQVRSGIILLSLLVYCISFSFFNFWPWYNHTVIVYQLIGLAFVLRYIFQENKYRWLYLLGGGFFLFLSFFTKQDGGGLGLLIALALLLYTSWHERSVKPIALFLGFYALTAAAFILPLLSYNFSYWFNYGQEPHFSRIAATDFLTEIFGASRWEKFYLLLIGLLLLHQVKSLKTILYDKREMVFLLLTLGIIVEALLFQVTSYVPPDNNIFFHSFAFAYILSHLNLSLQYQRWPQLALIGLLIMLWWSGSYWKYVDRIAARVLPAPPAEEEAVQRVSKSSWNQGVQADTTTDMGAWTFSPLPVFDRVYMPEKTNEGIARLLEMPVVKEKGSDLAMLNMSELTPLARTIGYALPTGPNQPVWYHQGVSVFQPQVDAYCKKIVDEEFDVVLFEYLKSLNNFYPFQIRDCLRENYQQVDSFPAPRSDSYTLIEVYVPK